MYYPQPQGGAHPQSQGGGAYLQSQGGGAYPQSQGGGAYPQSQGGGAYPQSQGGGAYPQSQGGGAYPQSQGGGAYPQSQGGPQQPQSGCPQPQSGGYPQPQGVPYSQTQGVGGTYAQPQGGAYSVDSQVIDWFRAVDVDNSGQITDSELQQALTNSDWSRFSIEACRMMINLFDRTGDGKIGMDEFQSLWRYIREWQGTFNSYDKNRSGFIEHQELQQALQSMGYQLSPQFLSLVIARYDPRHRRQISMDNFILTCVKLHLYTEGFRRKDVQGRGQVQLSYEDFLATVVATL